MTRAILPLALAGLVLPLGNALAAGDWLVALPLIVILAGGIVLLACDATPGCCGSTRPRSVATEAEQQGVGL